MLEPLRSQLRPLVGACGITYDEKKSPSVKVTEGAAVFIHSSPDFHDLAVAIDPSLAARDFLVASGADNSFAAKGIYAPESPKKLVGDLAALTLIEATCSRTTGGGKTAGFTLFGDEYYYNGGGQAKQLKAPCDGDIDVGKLAAYHSSMTFTVVRVVLFLLPGWQTRTVDIFIGLELGLLARWDGCGRWVGPAGPSSRLAY